MLKTYVQIHNAKFTNSMQMVLKRKTNEDKPGIQTIFNVPPLRLFLPRTLSAKQTITQFICFYAAYKYFTVLAHKNT